MEALIAVTMAASNSSATFTAKTLVRSFITNARNANNTNTAQKAATQIINRLGGPTSISPTGRSFRLAFPFAHDTSALIFQSNAGGRSQAGKAFSNARILPWLTAY
jgi:hypothetical protein